MERCKWCRHMPVDQHWSERSGLMLCAVCGQAVAEPISNEPQRSESFEPAPEHEELQNPAMVGPVDARMRRLWMAGGQEECWWCDRPAQADYQTTSSHWVDQNGIQRTLWEEAVLCSICSGLMRQVPSEQKLRSEQSAIAVRQILMLESLYK